MKDQRSRGEVTSDLLSLLLLHPKGLRSSLSPALLLPVSLSVLSPPKPLWLILVSWWLTLLSDAKQALLSECHQNLTQQPALPV